MTRDDSRGRGRGPLAGLKIIEMAGIGPAPFCGMLLSDLGADVLRVDRTEPSGLGLEVDRKFNPIGRGRRSLAMDLKRPEGVANVLRLVEKADALIEGFRPGVMERLGLGPDICLARNAKLVFGRMTGWGQDGPLAQAAGHDINYIALSGALHCIGAQGSPVPPLNLVGDFGGGALYLAFGVACALIDVARSGQGQVVDAAMVDGAASLMAMFYGMRAGGLWTDKRAGNLLDGGAPWYGVFATADDKWVAIGAIEPKFYAELIRLLGLAGADLPKQMDRKRWPELRQRLAAAFAQKTRDEWCRIMEGSDVCFAPVLFLDEAPRHAHMRARGTFVERDGVTQPAPAPRFSRTPGAIQGPAPGPGEGGEAALRDWGFDEAEIAAMTAEKTVA